MVGWGIYFLLAMLISLIKDSGPHSYMCEDLQSAAYIIPNTLAHDIA